MLSSLDQSHSQSFSSTQTHSQQSQSHKLSQNYFSALARGGLATAAICIHNKNNNSSPSSHYESMDRDNFLFNGDRSQLYQTDNFNNSNYIRNIFGASSDRSVRKSRSPKSIENNRNIQQSQNQHQLPRSQHYGNHKKLLSLMSGSDLQPLQEEISREEDGENSLLIMGNSIRINQSNNITENNNRSNLNIGNSNVNNSNLTNNSRINNNNKPYNSMMMNTFKDQYSSRNNSRNNSRNSNPNNRYFISNNNSRKTSPYQKGEQNLIQSSFQQKKQQHMLQNKSSAVQKQKSKIVKLPKQQQQKINTDNDQKENQQNIQQIFSQQLQNFQQQNNSNNQEQENSSKLNSIQRHSSAVSGDYNYDLNMDEAQFNQQLQQMIEDVDNKFDLNEKQNNNLNPTILLNYENMVLKETTHNFQMLQQSLQQQQQREEEDQLIKDLDPLSFNVQQKERPKQILESLKFQTSPDSYQIPQKQQYQSLPLQQISLQEQQLKDQKNLNQSQPVEKRLFDYQKKIEEKHEYQRRLKEQQEMQQLRPVPQISEKTNEIMIKKQMNTNASHIRSLNASTIQTHQNQNQAISLNNYNIHNNQNTIYKKQDNKNHNQSVDQLAQTQILNLQSNFFDPMSYQEELKKKEESRLKMIQEKEMKGFTGKPTINKKSQHIQRKLDDLLQWKDQQEKKREEELQRKLEQEQKQLEELQSHRVLSKHSEKLLENKYQQQRKQRVQDRLFRDASLRMKKQQQQELMYLSQRQKQEKTVSRGRNSKSRSRSNQRQIQNQQSQRKSNKISPFNNVKSNKNQKGQRKEIQQQNTLQQHSLTAIGNPFQAKKQQNRTACTSPQSSNMQSKYSSITPTNNVDNMPSFSILDMYKKILDNTPNRSQNIQNNQQPLSQLQNENINTKNISQQAFTFNDYSQLVHHKPSNSIAQSYQEQLTNQNFQQYGFDSNLFNNNNQIQQQNQIQTQAQKYQQQNFNHHVIDLSQRSSVISQQQQKAQQEENITIQAKPSKIQLQQQNAKKSAPASRKNLKYESLFDKLQRMNTSQNSSISNYNNQQEQNNMSNQSSNSAMAIVSASIPQIQDFSSQESKSANKKNNNNQAKNNFIQKTPHNQLVQDTQYHNYYNLYNQIYQNKENIQLQNQQSHQNTDVFHQSQKNSELLNHQQWHNIMDYQEIFNSNYNSYNSLNNNSNLKEQISNSQSQNQYQQIYLTQSNYINYQQNQQVQQQSQSNKLTKNNSKTHSRNNSINNVFQPSNTQDQIIYKILENSFIPSGNINQDRKISFRSTFEDLTQRVQSQDNCMNLKSDQQQLSQIQNPKDLNNKNNKENENIEININEKENQKLQDIHKNATNQNQILHQEVKQTIFSRSNKKRLLSKGSASHSQNKRSYSETRNLPLLNNNPYNGKQKSPTANNVAGEYQNLNFLQRSNKWLENKQNKIEQAKHLSEKRQERECPFKPQIKPITLNNKNMKKQSQNENSNKQRSNSQRVSLFKDVIKSSNNNSQSNKKQKQNIVTSEKQTPTLSDNQTLNIKVQSQNFENQFSPQKKLNFNTLEQNYEEMTKNQSKIPDLVYTQVYQETISSIKNINQLSSPQQFLSIPNMEKTQNMQSFNPMLTINQTSSPNENQFTNYYQEHEFSGQCDISNLSPTSQQDLLHQQYNQNQIRQYEQFQQEIIDSNFNIDPSFLSVGGTDSEYITDKVHFGNSPGVVQILNKKQFDF